AIAFFFFSSRRRHTRSVSAFLLNRSSDLMENTNLSKQQQVSEIMRQMLTQAQTVGQYFTNDQIKEMTRKVSAEVDLVHQQTQNRSEERRVGKECRAGGTPCHAGSQAKRAY